MGTTVLIGVSAEHGALYAVSEDGRPRLIATFGSPSAMALANGDQDVIVADASVSEVSLIRNFASAPETFRIAGESDGIAGPTGLGISADGAKLYIVDGRSRTLDIWNFESQSIETTLPLDARPTRLSPLQGTSTFILNEPGDHPLLLMDAINPAVYFVPAGRDRN
jgi:DNA-binding beta-propeller fold protein YncE